MSPAVLNTVALLEDVPNEGLVRGQVGTIIEDLGEGFWEVEFADGNGVAYAIAPLSAAQFLVLRHEPVAAA